MTKLKDKPKPKDQTPDTEDQAWKDLGEGLEKDIKVTPYEDMVGKRLDMLKHQFEEYPRPDYLEEGESKLVPFLMTSMAELFVRSDIVMDNINAMNTARDESSKDRT
jgi:hypothetical protein